MPKAKRWIYTHGLIYAVRCTVNDRRYIGRTTVVRDGEQSLETVPRWKGHLSLLLKREHNSKLMQADWDLYGSDKFCFEVLEIVNNGDLDEREIFWQRKLHPEYSPDYRLELGQELVAKKVFTELVALREGTSVVMAKDELKELRDRLAWLEQKVAVIDKRTRKRRKIVAGQLELLT